MTTEFITLYHTVLVGVAAGALSLFVTKSSLLIPFHDWLERRSPFLEKLLSCVWCTSHWIGFALMLVYRPLVLDNPVGWLFAPLDWVVTLMTVVFVAVSAAGVMSWALKQ